MAWKVVSLLGIALIALSDARPPVSEQKVKIENVGKKSEHHEAYVWSYPSYEFSYEVSDPHTHDFKGHHETRKGDDVKGYYWLIQPDGLKRTVKYHADKNSGLEAHVDYEKKNGENSNDENNVSNQEDNSNQENTSGENENEENGEENQESNGNNESNNKKDISSNDSENARNENNGEENAEGENQEQEGINISELEEISRKNYGGEQKGGYYRGRKYMGRRNEFYKTGVHSYRGKVKYGQKWHYNNDNNNEGSEPENNNEESNNEDSAGQVEQENNSNNNEESDNNEEGNEGENQEGDNAGNEQNGENSNANEQSSLNSEKSDDIAQKTEYHVIIHHPKYISMSKKSKRRT